MSKLLDPDSTGTEDYEKLLTVFASSMVSNIIGTMRQKSVFSTRNMAFLGMGHGSVLKDDQIWILQGAVAPVILRPLPNGHFKCCGDAYVYGIRDYISKSGWKSDAIRVTIE